jgi:dihydrodipicolinate synthase/N-acetylneuraminate lyase
MLKLNGVVPPMITPFDAEGNLDIAMLKKLVAFLKDNVDGLFICGSYGSGPLMSIEERKKVTEVTVDVVEGKIPVICHTGTTSTRDTVELTRHAEKVGCSAVSAVGPYYYHHDEENLLAFYGEMLKSVKPDFPVYVYYNPKFSGYNMSLGTLKKLKELGISGVKDATFDILLLANYMRELSDDNFDVVLGTEAMWLPACALGARAFMPGLGNAFPEICREMHREGMDREFEKCRETQFEVNRLRDIMYFAKSTQLAVYVMLELREIISAYPRAPFMPAGQKEKDDIKQALIQRGVL